MGSETRGEVAGRDRREGRAGSAQTIRLSALLAAMLLGLPGSLACGGDGLSRVRAVTYPPDFHYITRQEIRTTMGRLAVEVVALDEIMQKEGGLAPEDHALVVAILTRMKALSGSIKKGAKSNHPRIDQDAPRLREGIQRALDGAMARPPNYFQAGRVAEACTYCHAPRHETSAP